jgi:NAD(P)H-dependent FMN reductase
MKILLLVGSGDAQSHSLGLGRAIEAELHALGAETELINLVEYRLPLYDRSVERADAYDEKTRAFLEKSYAADAFVWITPIHHNSFSAILKNALDWQHTKFPGKVVGLASNGGHRSPQAVDQLMLVARAQHLVSSRTRVCTDKEDYDEKLHVTNQDIKARVKDFAEELVELTKKVKH